METPSKLDNRTNEQRITEHSILKKKFNEKIDIVCSQSWLNKIKNFKC